MPHIHELIDFTISAFIVNDRKVLMVNHRKLNRWLPIGGHIELDQDPEEALFNEIKEETGLTRDHLTVHSDKPQIKSPGTKFLYSSNYLDIHEISATHRHVGLIYFLSSDTNSIILAEREHSEIKWLSVEDLESPRYDLLPSIKFYAAQALKKSEESLSN